MKNEHLIVVGAAVTAVGTFLPVISLPFGATINYFNNGQGDGVFVLIAATATALLALTDLKRFSWIPVGAGLALTLYSFINALNLIGQTKSNLEQELEGNPFAGLATGLMSTVSLQYGWLFLILGALVSLFGAWKLHLEDKESGNGNDDIGQQGEQGNA